MKLIHVLMNISKNQLKVKKKYNTFTKLLAVTKEGFIWFICKSFPGSLNDINLSNFPSNKISRSRGKNLDIVIE